MPIPKGLARAAFVILLLVDLACSSRRETHSLQLLVLPLENMSGDESLDWENRLAPAVFGYDLEGVQRIALLRETAAPENRANRILQGYFWVSGNRLMVHAALEDPQNRKTLRVLTEEGPSSQGVVPLLNRMAKEFGAGAREFSSQDPEALRSYSQALASTDPSVRVHLLQTAIGEDPKFTSAYIALAEVLLEHGDSSGAEQAAQKGQAVASNGIDRARLDYLLATAENNSAWREKALDALLRLAPGNLDVLHALAELHTLQRNFPKAIEDYTAWSRQAPNDPAVYNVLGYLHGYVHDLKNARADFQKYQELAGPGNANPEDSLGEVYFFNGDFAAAERAFLAAQQQNPSGGSVELVKAAQARLMQGDPAGADQLFEKSIQGEHGWLPGVAETERARWEFLTGRRKAAMSRMEKQAESQGDVAVLAGSQLAIWKLQTGDREGAAKLAAQASARATSPNAKSLAAMCQFLAAAPSRTSQFPFINAVALILNREFAPARQPLETVFWQTQPDTDAQVRTLLAWDLVETGQAARAGSLVDRYPMVLPASEPLFATLIFPRFLQIRAMVLKTEQKLDEARRNQELFDRYAGDVPDRWPVSK